MGFNEIGQQQVSERDEEHLNDFPRRGEMRSQVKGVLVERFYLIEFNWGDH